MSIKSEQLNIGKRSVWMNISRLQIIRFRTLSSIIATGWCGWRSGYRWHQLWCQLSVLLGWRCTRSLATPACLRICCGAILARKGSIHVVWMRQGRVFYYRSLFLSMSRILNMPHCLFPDISARFLDQVLCFLSWSAQKPSFGHFGHIEYQVHGRLFQLYPTS